MTARNIPRETVLGIMENPQQTIAASHGRLIYQSQYFDLVEGKNMLLRVIVEPDILDPAVISVYKTSRIEKYWLEA
jgi:hypothetical protein